MRGFPVGVMLLVLGCALTNGLFRCEFRNYLIPEQPYYIYSPGYPRNFTSDIQCRWIVTSPPGFVCRLNCSELVLAQSSSCSPDRLLVSNNGDPLLSTANVYCGRRSVTEVSVGRRMVLSKFLVKRTLGYSGINAREMMKSLLTSRLTPGGRFLCEVTAEKENMLNLPSLAELGFKQ